MSSSPLTFVDFIDPELQDMQRIIASLNWEFADNQALILYYLDQADRSDSYAVGDFEDVEKIDESDADLSWSGISYLGGFEFEALSVGGADAGALLATVLQCVESVEGQSGDIFAGGVDAKDAACFAHLVAHAASCTVMC